MSRVYTNVYEKVYSFANLWLAARKARRGKRLRPEVVDFEYDLEKNLLALQDKLYSQSYHFSPYRQFTVYEPKERRICAAPYRDRVVHHALCNVIEPLLDKAMIYDSYACRVGKGMHRALDRAQHFLRGHRYVLKMDIRKYFFTVDQQLLLADLAKRIADERLLTLLGRVLDTYTTGDEYYFAMPSDLPIDRFRPRGLPIGNLTSQLLANCFLDPVDRYIKEQLKCKGYLRYMDDLLLFGQNKAELQQVKAEIGAFLQESRLCLHPQKTQVFPAKNGVPYLGFHLYSHCRRIQRGNLQRFTRKFKKRVELFQRGTLSHERLLLSLNAWLGFADREKHRRLINHLLEHIPVAVRQGEKYTFYIP
jgi:RNA-directed DNA polymerase